MEIKRERVNYNNLSNNVFTTLVNAGVDIATAQGIVEGHVTSPCMVTIISNLAILKSILNVEITPHSRLEYDDERDADFTYIVNMIEANLANRDAAKQLAAVSVYSVFDSFNKKLIDMAYDAETAELDKTLTVWTSAANAAHFATLALTDDLARLVSSAEAFKQFTIETTEDGNTDMPKVRELRLAIAKAFVMWLDVMKGFANLADDELCYTTLSRINQLIKEQDALLKAKATRSVATDVDEDASAD